MSRLCTSAAVAWLITLAPSLTLAQRAATPAALAELVAQRFASGSPESFDSAYPDAAGRAVVRSAVQQHQARRADLDRVVREARGHAVLLLAGTVSSASSEDEANRARAFSGLYEAVESNGAWTLSRKLPIDSMNYIRGHVLHVALVPGHGLDVVDTMTVEIGSASGFTARLNGRARLATVRLDGREPEHAFGGSVLWVRSAPRRRAQLVLTYALDEDTRGGGDSTHARVDTAVVIAGQYHNTFVWHPYFEYSSANDVGNIDVTVRLPERYRLTTTLPQTESVRDGLRTVRGRGAEPAFLAALLYDREWQPRTTLVDGVRVETFLTPSFPFSHDSLVAAFRPIYRLLRSRFGALRSQHLAVVEDRALGQVGFRVRMNDAVITGRAPKSLIDTATIPAAPFAHEISHVWTMNATGPAANFLREGWATYIESLVLGDQFGPGAQRALIEIARNGYLTSSEGTRSIIGDPDNGNLHYAKGVWIFSMLNHVLGDSTFDRGMRAYMSHFGGRAGYEELIASLSSAAGRDLHAFVMPWLAEKYIPDVTATVDGPRVILSQVQRGAVFELPLDLELTTAGGTIRRTARLTHRVDTLVVGDIGAVSAVRVDPDHHFLLQRHMGEIVRFELRAPDAKSVVLMGVTAPTPATRTGDVWAVELPLAEGRYFWAWRVDGRLNQPGSGDPDKYGIRVVQPLRPLPAPK